MRITAILDDEPVASARDHTGFEDTSALLDEALIALVQREAGRRLVLLGGSDISAKAAPGADANHFGDQPRTIVT